MFHGIPWNLVICHLAAPEFHGIPWNIPWNCMEHMCLCDGALLIPWNPMELGDFLFGDSRVPWNSMEYPLEIQPG